jgi:tripartite-type tricarboxylate transporter receptor subunit TctC
MLRIAASFHTKSGGNHENNRIGGASGSIGAAQVAKSPPDGSNWLFVFDTHAVNPFLQNLSFDTEKDLEPVLLIGKAPNLLATHPELPFKTFADRRIQHVAGEQDHSGRGLGLPLAP